MPSTNLYCSLQNRLGGLDRVLLAFTHRGIIPNQMFCTHNEENQSLELSITFESNCETALQKLVKALQTHVYVLEVRVTNLEMNNNEIPQTVKNFATNPMQTAKLAQAVPA